MKTMILLPLFLSVLGCCGAARAEDAVFSGPQKGEKATAFKVVELTGEKVGQEREVAAGEAKPVALVFVHGIERSLMPLLRVVDQYGAERRDKLSMEIVFLAADRIAGEQRVRAAAGAVKLQSRVGLSPDGTEGPGNYGLNKDCLMTIVVAKDGTVTDNLALVQPGIADAPKVLAALAKVCGDASPPTAEELTARHVAQAGGGRDGGMMRRGREETDLSKFDLNTEAGLRDAVKGLIGEVRSLRAELAALRGATPASPRAERPKQEAPGAPPTDEKLLGLLRRFIQPTNDDATVDKVLAEVRGYLKDDAPLKKQALDGWTRILHFGDRYGTAYARKAGQEFLDELKREAK